MPRAPNPSKVGLKRIDAAIDAVRPLGFPAPLIRKTVRNLLKVYGGDDGWPFIEEFSYKLLIDTILEEEEKTNTPLLLESTQSVLMIENVSKDNMNEDGSRLLIEYSEKHSNQVESSRSQSPPTKKRAIQVQNPSSSSSALPIAVPCSSKGVITEAKRGEQITLSKISAGSSSPQVKVCSLGKKGSTEVKSCQLLLPAKRRKPCYGWLDSDDDDVEPAELSK